MYIYGIHSSYECINILFYFQNKIFKIYTGYNLSDNTIPLTRFYKKEQANLLYRLIIRNLKKSPEARLPYQNPTGQSKIAL